MYSEENVNVGEATSGIPVFDIELPTNGAFQYDEGIRGTTSYRAYKPGNVGTASSDRPFFRYRDENGELIEEELKEEDKAAKDRYGKLVTESKYTFYQLLERYYSERNNPEYEWK